jgi:hypothetical protein
MEGSMKLEHPDGHQLGVREVTRSIHSAGQENPSFRLVEAGDKDLIGNAKSLQAETTAQPRDTTYDSSGNEPIKIHDPALRAYEGEDDLRRGYSDDGGGLTKEPAASEFDEQSDGHSNDSDQDSIVTAIRVSDSERGRSDATTYASSMLSIETVIHIQGLGSKPGLRPSMVKVLVDVSFVDAVGIISFKPTHSRSLLSLQSMATY